MTAFFHTPSALPPQFGKSLMSASVLALLAACGGGGNSSPATISLSGTVVADQALSNVLVCADLNGNQACDANEPKAAASTASLPTWASRGAARKALAAASSAGW